MSLLGLRAVKANNLDEGVANVSSERQWLSLAWRGSRAVARPGASPPYSLVSRGPLYIPNFDYRYSISTEQQTAHEALTAAP